MDTLAGILVGVFVVLAITGVTGYFVAQEFAYMAVDRSKLAARAAEGDGAAAAALRITQRTSFMLSGAQLGITVTGLLVGYVAQPLIGRGLGEVIGSVGLSASVAVATGTLLAVGFSTIVQMVFGELVPKNLAIARPEPMARSLAYTTRIYLAAFGWLIFLFDRSANLLLRAFGIEPVHDLEHSATALDLEHIVAESADTGELPKDLSRLLDRVLDFPTRTAEHAMRPRHEVDTVSIHASVADVLTTMSRGHTRYPVIGSTRDDPRGVIQLHDLLADESPTGTVGSRMRRAVSVPTSLPLPEVMARLSESGDEMALVVDEYGGFAGVVTIEDLAEELVGDIADEHDVDEPSGGLTGSAEQGWEFPGDLHIDEIEREIDVDLPTGDYETLAGLLITATGSFPAVGDVIAIPLPADPNDLIDPDRPDRRLLRARVLAIGRHVPSLVHVRVVDEAASDGKDSGRA